MYGRTPTARPRTTGRIAMRFVLAIALASAPLTFSAGQAHAAAVPFADAPGTVFVSQQSPTVLYEASTRTDGSVEFNQQGSAATFVYNAIAYEPNSDLLYGVGTSGAGLTNTVLRIGQLNGYDVVNTAGGTPFVLPGPGYNVATFGTDGVFYAGSSATTQLRAIDVTSAAPHVIGLIDISLPGGGSPLGADIAYKDGYIWSVVNGTIVRITPSTGAAESWPLRNTNGATITGSYGAQWQYGNGNLGISNNSSGVIYQIHIDNPTSSTPTFSVVSTQSGPGSLNNDGAANPGQPVDLSLLKTASHGGGGDNSVTFSLTVKNDDATYPSSGYHITDVLPSGMTGPYSVSTGCEVTTPTYGANAGETVVSCDGSRLDPGESRTFTIVGYLDGSPDCVINSATVVGNEADPAPGNDSDSETVCLSDLDVSKQATLSSDGRTVDFTVTVHNTGTAPYTTSYPAKITDDLSAVLDDLTFNGTITTTYSGASSAGSASGSLSATTLSWSGPLAADETATIRYSASVPAGSFLDGDFTATNNACVNIPLVDECATTSTPLPALRISKSVSPDDRSTVLPGDVMTYTIRFDNTDGEASAVVDEVDDLEGVLDDASMTTQPAASTNDLVASEVANGSFTVQGSVPAGQMVTVTYRVTVKPDGQRGDNTLANFVVPAGVDPPTTCATGSSTCTVNYIAELVIRKSVDPADGSSVAAGSTLAYTVTFDNSGGTASKSVDVVDYLSGVLDDATLTTAPDASTNDLTVTSITDGQFRVTGSVPGGATIRVTYQVTVKADGSRGDNVLLNAVLPPGASPPAQCDADDPLCTTNPVVQMATDKSVDPADGSTVAAGDALRYTLTFDNTAVPTATPVDVVDNLTKVLDDADVTTAPSSSSDALAVSAVTEGSFTIKGSVPAGEKVTVTYVVTVKPDGQRGDNAITNFVLRPGVEPPSACSTGEALCTENRVTTPPAAVRIDKTIAKVEDVNGNGTNDAGDRVTYGFLVKNTGQQPLSGLIVRDAKLSDQPLTCEASTLAVGATMTCHGPAYTLTAADVSAGVVKNIATVKGKSPLGDLDSSDTAVLDLATGQELADTGAGMGMLALVGALAAAGGVLLVATSRRRRA